MNLVQNHDYTTNEISELLKTIKKCIEMNRYTISLNVNRQENSDFIDEYNIRSDVLKCILLQIKVEDFCHSLKNMKQGYEHEVLFVFVPCVQLIDSEGKKETVDIYTKFNIVNSPSGKRTIVISFHKRNKPISYPFR